MNNCTFIGNVVNDPETRYLDSGTPVLHWRFAINGGYGKHKKTMFIGCDLLGKRAESLQQYIHKGMKLGVSGELWQREYEGKNGKRQSLDLNVNQVEFCQSSQSEKKQEEPYYSDDIPF